MKFIIFKGHLGGSKAWFTVLGRMGFGGGIYFIKLPFSMFSSCFDWFRSLFGDSYMLESLSLLELLKM
jgi:hypothetical protein